MNSSDNISLLLKQVRSLRWHLNELNRMLQIVIREGEIDELKQAEEFFNTSMKQKVLSKLSEEDRRLAQLMDEGYTLTEIAKKLGWTRGKTNTRSQNIPMRVNLAKANDARLYRHPYSEEEIKKLIEMTEHGATCSQISEEIKHPRGSVYVIQRRLRAKGKIKDIRAGR